MEAIGVRILKALMEHVLQVYQKPEKIHKVIVEEDKCITEYHLDSNVMIMRYFNGTTVEAVGGGKEEQEEQTPPEEVFKAWDKYLRKSRKIQVL